MAAEDTFRNEGDTALVQPATIANAVEPDDEEDLDYVTRGIYVGTAGDVRMDTSGGSTVTFANLAAGVIHPIRATRIYETGTTAQDILQIV